MRSLSIVATTPTLSRKTADPATRILALHGLQLRRSRYRFLRLEGETSHAPQRPDDRRPHRDIWDKVSIHDVDMDTIGPSTFGFGNLFTQARKVGIENRWRRLHNAALGVDSLFYAHAARSFPN